MKKIIALSTVISLFLLFTSCNFGGKGAEDLDTSDFRVESALQMYQISIPKYMKKAEDLNADASMQFQNIFKETYLAIIDEDKTDFVDVFKELGQYDDGQSIAGNYRNVQMDYFTEGMNMLSDATPKKVTINGLDAEQVAFTARVPEVDYDIYYIITFIEGRENVYMVMEWTLAEYEEKYKTTFLQMIDTFTEI
ncbi:hypothetical protein POV27_08110 [Aureisphaera galaxeae]|uniref:hypothetical protein n=1 Tax=Aureisphaera galaxeae TaxID=1538023 RepID=UPI002350B754|nr:hypothetical protein [Aureisphaera galaxeae]MDC8004013.1 hypothetical protein [Aureisphaera galaxeae]